MNSDERIQLGHGGGGRLSRDLIDREILSRFGDGPLAGLPDGATLPEVQGRLVFSTDSFVVHPLIFPGGCIGDLAVHGTVNDIAACGGRPRWLSLAMILEEGLELATLRVVLDAVKAAADDCGVTVVTGDTKVVARGQCDGLYLNTAGIGEVLPGFALTASSATPGDRVLVSGPIGDHGMAVMAAREGIRIENGPESDSAPVHRLVQALQPWAEDVRFMRDPTRGGVATVLNELVDGQAFGLRLDEGKIPTSTGTRAIAEALGIDLLHVACEGRLIAVLAPDAAAPALEAWRCLAEGRSARDIGEVSTDAGRVVLETGFGGARLVDVPQGELLPRIC